MSHLFDRNGSGTTGLTARVTGRLARWWARRRTVHILRSLDDHTLRDIGVRRSEISAVVASLLRAPEPGEAPSGSPGRASAHSPSNARSEGVV